MSDFKLLEIDQAIEDAIDNFVDPETGELLSEEETLKLIEALEYEKLEKIKYLSRLVVNKTAELEALKEHKRQIDKRMKSTSGSIERLKSFIKVALKGEKFKDETVSVSYRNNRDVTTIDMIEAIPDEYFKTPHTESNLNKTAIKEAIQNGQLVPGCHLEDTVSVIIK